MPDPLSTQSAQSLYDAVAPINVPIPVSGDWQQLVAAGQYTGPLPAGVAGTAPWNVQGSNGMLTYLGRKSALYLIEYECSVEATTASEAELGASFNGDLLPNNSTPLRSLITLTGPGDRAYLAGKNFRFFNTNDQIQMLIRAFTAGITLNVLGMRLHAIAV